MKETISTANHDNYRRITNEKNARVLASLATDTRFLKECAVNGDDLTATHVMYKLVEPQLWLADGRGYEFVIEYDKDDIEYGIYFGCRGLFPKMEETEALRLFDEEFEELRGYILQDLKNAKMNVDDDSFEVTNNTSSRSYWPFWLRMSADLTTTINALISIRTNYEWFLSSQAKLDPRKVAYADYFTSLMSALGTPSRNRIVRFFDQMEKDGYIVKRGYRNEWDLAKSITIRQFAIAWNALCRKDGQTGHDPSDMIRARGKNMSVTEQYQRFKIILPPTEFFPNNVFKKWEVASRLFFHNGKPLRNLEKQLNQAQTATPRRLKSQDENEEKSQSIEEIIAFFQKN